MRPVDPPPGPGAGAVCVQAQVLGEGGRGATAEWVAEEVPVALAVNGISHAVMLATPLDLEDFALGFLLSEGLIDTPADLLDVELLEEPAGITLALQVTQRCLHRFKEVRRSLAGRTGCGICGTESLQHAVRPVTRAVASVQVSAAAIARAMQQLAQHQTLLAAISAPTRLAVSTAEAAGLALVGFARGDHAVVYTHADRVLQAPTAD